MFGHQHLCAEKPNISRSYKAKEIHVVYEDLAQKRAEWQNHLTDIRNRAQKLDQEVAERTVRYNLTKNPPSIYHVGDSVLSRIITTASRKQRTSVVDATILRRNTIKHTYRIRYLAENGTVKEKWLPVNDVTSTTIEQEEQRQQHSKTLAARGYFKHWPQNRREQRRNDQGSRRRRRTGQPCRNVLCWRGAARVCSFKKCLHCCKRSLHKCKNASHNMPYLSR
ncbi:uncharacterized protein LOC144880632 [Branchiostoma floridae x Branchiostoma japonicum]